MTREYIIMGDPRTKKNSQQIVGGGKRCPACGKPAKQWIMQSKANKVYTRDAVRQLQGAPKAPAGRLNVKALFYMKTRRRVDLLNLLEAVDDILTEAGIIDDDNASIIGGHDGSRVLYDPHNPRTEICITPLYMAGDQTEMEET